MFNDMADSLLELIDPVTIEELLRIEVEADSAIGLTLKNTELSQEQTMNLRKITNRLSVAQENADLSIIEKSNQIKKKLTLLSKLF